MGWGAFNEDEPVDPIQNFMKTVKLGHIPNNRCKKRIKESVGNILIMIEADCD